jgi:hypothetical protein
MKRSYYTKEDILQANCVKYLLLAYPKLKWIHSPNEGKRTMWEQKKMNYIGGKRTKGFPDLFIITPPKNYHGCAIELKVIYESGKKNYPTKEQKQWLKDLDEVGYYTEVIYTFDDFKKTIDKLYL